MIVTCPGCSSKYRVRNESVPADGARMRCPKCETLFLAKPPIDGSTTVDDPSSMYQQLLPQGARTNTGPLPAVPVTPGASVPPAPAPAPGVGLPQAGPITALFAAVDPGQLPPEALRPAAPGPSAFPAPHTAAPTPTGVSVAEAPRVRTVPGTSPVLRDPTPPAARPPPGRGAVASSWAALGLGGVVFLGGALTWAWTTEALPLDGALMPVARALFSAERPADAPVDVDAARRLAIEAAEKRDLPAAIVAWRRVKDHSPDTDRRPSEAIAKNLVDLGEVP